MPDGNFSDFITQERDRLNGERQNIMQQQRELQTKLTELDREMEAITAYESAKSGKASGGGVSGAGRRVRNGSRREELLKLIGEGNGLSRGDLLERLGLKGNKAGEMAVSNALTGLTKSNAVRREDGKYHQS